MKLIIKDPSKLKTADVCEDCLNVVNSCDLCGEDLNNEDGFLCLYVGINNEKGRHICYPCIERISKNLEMQTDK